MRVSIGHRWPKLAPEAAQHLEKGGKCGDLRISYLLRPAVSINPLFVISGGKHPTQCHVLPSLLYCACRLWAKSMRILELDEKAVGVQPLPIDRFSDVLSEVGIGIGESDVSRDAN